MISLIFPEGWFLIHWMCFSRYDTEGVLVGQLEWYQGVDFITCIKNSAKPLTLSYLQANENVMGITFSSRKFNLSFWQHLKMFRA